jgi:hypothetical protein
MILLLKKLDRAIREYGHRRVTVETHQVTVKIHQVTVETHQVTVETHQVTVVIVKETYYLLQ